MDPNESESADFEPDDNLLDSLPIDEAGGRGPDEPADPVLPDDAPSEHARQDDSQRSKDGEKPRSKDGEDKGLVPALTRLAKARRGRDITDQPAYGFWLVIISLGLVTAAFIVTVYHYDNARSVVTVMGVLTGIMGALVGAFFGVRGATYASLVHRPQRDSSERDEDRAHGNDGQRDHEARAPERRDRRPHREGHRRGGG